MNRSISLGSLLFIFSLGIFSFSVNRGGDSFTIYLNDKLILQQFIYADKSVKHLSLSEARPGDELRVHFSHCGAAGKRRTLTLFSQTNEVVKKLHFADGKNFMVCKVKDIPGWETGSLKLVYSSSELPGGYVLAWLVKENAKKNTTP